jgi:hypothetical protein
MDSDLSFQRPIPWKYYEKNRKRAYYDSIWRPVKERRFGHEYYDVYHFFMPERTFYQAKLLRRYFMALDTLTSAKPAANRYRQSPIELFDTALDVLEEMRKNTWTFNSQYIGSDHISPIAWACLGFERDQRINCRHHFKTFYNLMKFYDSQLASEKQFNIMRVYRRQNGTYDKISTFSNVCDISYNRVLAVAISFLFDLVTNNGPDSECFIQLHTNDKELIDVNLWKHVYDNVVKTRVKIPEYRTNKIYNRCCAIELHCYYSEVQISDVINDFPTRNSELIKPDFET